MLIKHYLEQYIMPFLNPTCNMDVNYGGKHKQVLQNIEKIQDKALRIINLKNPREPSEQIYKESKMFKLKDIVTISNLKFAYDQMNKILTRAFENFLLVKPDNIFITQEETPLMLCK